MASQVRALRELAAPIVARHGADLEDVVVRGAGSRRLVRLVVDHDGLDLDLVARISRDVSRALDASPAMGSAAYVLEVTSPGVDRPLTSPRHWSRAVGRLVRVTRDDGTELTGRIRAADSAAAELDVDGRVVELAYAGVTRAVVQVELGRAAGDDDAASGQEG